MSTVKKFFRYLALVLLIIILISLIRDIFFGQFSFQENEKLEKELASIYNSIQNIKDLLENNQVTYGE